MINTEDVSCNQLTIMFSSMPHSKSSADFRLQSQLSLIPAEQLINDYPAQRWYPAGLGVRAHSQIPTPFGRDDARRATSAQ